MPTFRATPLQLLSDLTPANGRISFRVTNEFSTASGDLVTTARGSGFIVAGVFRDAAGALLAIPSTPPGSTMEIWRELIENRRGVPTPISIQSVVFVPDVAQIVWADLVPMVPDHTAGNQTQPTWATEARASLSLAVSDAAASAAAGLASRNSATLSAAAATQAETDAQTHAATVAAVVATTDGLMAAAAQTAGGLFQTELDNAYGPSGPDFITWGDSLTAQGYPAILAPVIAQAVLNGGVGGESSQAIAARQGAIPYLLLPVGGQIPASGPVTVTIAEPVNVWPLLQGDGIPNGTFDGTLAGVSGTLTLVQPTVEPIYLHHSDDYYVFTRATTGAAVSVTRPEPFRSDFSNARRKDVAIIWAGRNNTWELSRVQADIRAMVRHLDTPQPRFLILGVTNGRLESDGSSSYTAIDALNTALSNEYGRRFIELRKYLVNYGLSDAAIPPTSGDLSDVAVGIIPNSLRSDAVHLTAAGRTVVANLVGKRLNELGWASTYAPATYPVSPAAHTNLITNSGVESNLNGWDGGAGAIVTRVTNQAFAGVAGVQCVHVAAGGSSARYGNANGVLVSVTGGQRINATVRAKGPLIANHNFRFLVHHYDAAGAYIANFNTTFVTTGDWQKLSVSGLLPANAVRVLLEVNKGGDGTHTDTVYVDDLDVWQ